MSENLDYKKIVESLLEANNAAVNATLVKNGFFLDKFVNDDRDCVRIEVAKKAMLLKNLLMIHARILEKKF